MQTNQYASNVNVEDVERRLPTASDSDGVKFNANNYLNTKLDKGEQKRVVNIRILPIDMSGNLCAEIFTHGLKVPYEVAKSGYKSFMCLNDKRNPNYDPNVPCPLCAKGTELWQASEEAKKKGDPASMALSKSLADQAKPFFRKTTYIFRVIDRDHEEQGVKFWRFNGRNDKKDPYNELINLFAINRAEVLKFQGVDGYNMFDIYQGKDAMLTLTLDKKGEREYTAVSVSVSGYMTPLSQNPELANQWLNDPKKWTDVYTHKSAEYLQIISEGLVPRFNQDTQHYEGVKPKVYGVPNGAQQQQIPPQQPNGTNMAPQQPIQQGGYPQQLQQSYQPAPAPQQYQQQYPPQGYPQQPQTQQYAQPAPQQGGYAVPPQQPMAPQPQPMNGNNYPPQQGR